jgi:hypothetical protein
MEIESKRIPVVLSPSEVALLDNIKAHMQKTMGPITNIQAIRVMMLYYAKKEKLGA